MGRQLAIMASRVDEHAFLAHLRDLGPIQLFRRTADSKRELWVETLPRYSQANSQYFIWNQDFAWRPHVVAVRPESNQGPAWFRIENWHTGPVFEFSRTDMKLFLRHGPGPLWGGRIYCPPYRRPLGFVKWFDSIQRWVRRQGHVLAPAGSLKCCCLPDAWRRWQRRPGGTP